MSSKIPVKFENLSAASRRSYGVTGYWEDLELKCHNCHASFSFSAEQQREWYERKQKHLAERPAFCPSCFGNHSQRRGIKGRMDDALQALKASPTDSAKLEAAESIVQFYQREKRGDIELAIRLLREVLRSDPTDRRALKLSRVFEKLRRA